MHYINHYASPMGNMLLAADDLGLTGLWFEEQKYFARCLNKDPEEKDLPVFEQAKAWLDLYFAGKEPDVPLPLHFIGTDFQKEVWEILCTIPYGQTMTYGEIAKQLAAARGISRMSAQAVGGAVGHNELSIIVPCHRVVGTNGSLTGYAGGMDKKVKLLTLEKVDMTRFFIPGKRGEIFTTLENRGIMCLRKNGSKIQKKDRIFPEKRSAGYAAGSINGGDLRRKVIWAE